MRARPKHKPVLRLALGIARDPPLRVEDLRVWVHLWVVQRRVAGRDDHGALGDGVVGCDGEGSGCLVRDEDDGGTVAEEFLDYCVCVCEGVEHGEIKGSSLVTAPSSKVFFADSVHDVRSLREDLEQPCRRAAGRILRRKQESEERPRNLLIFKFSNQVRWLHHTLLPLYRDLFPVPLRFHHVLHPLIHDTSRFSTRGHVDLARRGTSRKLLDDSVSNPLPAPRLSERDIQRPRDIDQLQRGGNEIEVIGNLLDGVLRDVVTEKGPARQRTVDLPEQPHKGHWLPAMGRAGGDESVKVIFIDLLLDGQVRAQGFVGKETHETAAVLGVGLAVKEDPGFRADDVLGDGDEAWLCVGW